MTLDYALQSIFDTNNTKPEEDTGKEFDIKEFIGKTGILKED